MEWIETTAKSVDDAKDIALDQLGIGVDDAEFEVLEEPRTGLFGRIRGEARVRARVRPAPVRPKQERRQRRRGERGDDRRRDGRGSGDGRSRERQERRPRQAAQEATDGTAETAESGTDPAAATTGQRSRRGGGGRGHRRSGGDDGAATRSSSNPSGSEAAMSDSTNDTSAPAAEAPSGAVDPADVQRAAEEFTSGLLEAFGVSGSTTSTRDGIEIDVTVEPTEEREGLGLLVGPAGQTLVAVQDLARVAAQRRLGDHDTRLRIDIAGYREKRRVALERFARHVAELVLDSGIARSMDPMPSADRKVVHDTLATIDGVDTRSAGEDPDRRIIVSPSKDAPEAVDADTAGDAPAAGG